MRALITNDDGIASEGLVALAQAARDLDLAVTVVAPSWDSSGASSSLTAVEDDGRLLITNAEVPGLEGLEAYAVDATPAFIVRAAVHGAFGEPPGLVLSGINRGRNTGQAVLHSGTVGAALTAATFDTPAAAFSLDVANGHHWEAAASVAKDVVRWMVEESGPVVLNVNVPDVEPAAVKGLKSARLSTFGAVQTSVTDVGKGYVKLAYTELDEVAEPGTDTAGLAQGYAVYTSLRSVCESDLPLPNLGH